MKLLPTSRLDVPVSVELWTQYEKLTALEQWITFTLWRQVYPVVKSERLVELLYLMQPIRYIPDPIDQVHKVNHLVKRLWNKLDGKYPPVMEIIDMGDLSPAVDNNHFWFQCLLDDHFACGDDHVELSNKRSDATDWKTVKVEDINKEIFRVSFDLFLKDKTVSQLISLGYRHPLTMRSIRKNPDYTGELDKDLKRTGKAMGLKFGRSWEDKEEFVYNIGRGGFSKKTCVREKHGEIYIRKFFYKEGLAIYKKQLKEKHT
jgi:hypothetical protein